MSARHLPLLLLTLLLLASPVMAQESSGPFVFVTTFDGKIYKVDAGTSTVAAVFNIGEGRQLEDAAIGPDGKLYVCESIADRIFRIDQDGFNYEQVYVKVSESDPSGPEGISFDSLGNAFFNTRGAPSTHTGLWELPGLANVPLEGTMPAPVKKVDAFSTFGEGTTTRTRDGSLLLVDSSGGRVLRTPHDFSTPPEALIVELSAPVGVATRSNGDILVMEENGAARRFDSSGESLGTLFTLPVGGEFTAGLYLEVDASDRTYATLFDTNSETEIGGLYKHVGESLTKIVTIVSAVGVAVGPSSVSRTQSFSPTQTTATFDFGVSKVVLSFPGGVMLPGFDVTMNRVETPFSNLQADLAAFPFVTCVHETTAGGNCTFTELSGFIPKKGNDYRGNPVLRFNVNSLDVIQSPGIKHDREDVPGSQFTVDDLKFFSPLAGPDDPAGEGATDNFTRFVFTNQIFDHLHFPCLIEPDPTANQSFTLGTVIRFRFRLTNNPGCTGGAVSDARPRLSVLKMDSEKKFQPVKSGQQTGNFFDFNPITNRYVYHLKTVGYTPGPHCATVHFDFGGNSGALPFTTCFTITP